MTEDALAQLVAAVSNATASLEPPGHRELLQSAVDTARELFGAAACSVAVADEAAEELVYEIASGAGATEILGVRLPMGRGIAGWVASSGSIIAVNDVRADPRFARDVAESTGYVPTSILAAPLEAHDRVLGVLSVLDRRSPDSAADAHNEMRLLGLIARQVALSLEAGTVFSDSARLLAQALAGLSNDTDVADALLQAGLDLPEQRTDLTSLAAMFARLHAADPELAELAADTIESFIAVARRRAAW
jgi:GAF domain-containing protein